MRGLSLMLKSNRLQAFQCNFCHMPLHPRSRITTNENSCLFQTGHTNHSLCKTQFGSRGTVPLCCDPGQLRAAWRVRRPFRTGVLAVASSAAGAHYRLSYDRGPSCSPMRVVRMGRQGACIVGCSRWLTPDYQHRLFYQRLSTAPQRQVTKSA